MNLYKQTYLFIVWFRKVFSHIFKAYPLPCFLVVTFTISGIFANLLAFMLPLKVILLVGTPGIPRYFQFFIQPEEKMFWVIVLIVASLLCYGMTLFFEWANGYISKRIGRRLLKKANDISVSGSSFDEISGFYLRINSFFSSLLFVFFVSIAIYFLNFNLFIFVWLYIISVFIISQLILLTYDPIKANVISNFVVENRKSFVELLYAVAFYSGFVVIIIPFLIEEDASILVAIISFLLLRQMLGELKSAIGLAVKLHLNHLKINSLFFRNEKSLIKEKKTNLAFYDLFSVKGRVDTVDVSVFDNSHLELDAVYWKDTTLPNVHQFCLNFRDKSQNHYYLQNVVALKHKHFFDNEDFLFSCISRSKLLSPPLVSRYQLASFDIEILNVAAHKPVSENFIKLQPLLLKYLWCLKIPQKLIDAYTSTHPLIYERLDKISIDKVSMAAHSTDEQAVIDKFNDNYPILLEYLQSIPLVLINPDLNGANVYYRNDDTLDLHNVTIASWIRWKLEPFGFGFPNMSDNHFCEFVDHFKKTFNITDSFFVDKVRLVPIVYNLEANINRMQFGQALNTMNTLNKLISVLEEKLSNGIAKDHG